MKRALLIALTLTLLSGSVLTAFAQNYEENTNLELLNNSHHRRVIVKEEKL